MKVKSLFLVLGLVIIFLFSRSTSETFEEDRSALELRKYIDSLRELQRHWRKAGELLSLGDKNGAQKEFENVPKDQLGEVWQEQNKSRAGRLEWLVKTALDERSNNSEFYFDLERPDLAERFLVDGYTYNSSSILGIAERYYNSKMPAKSAPWLIRAAEYVAKEPRWAGDAPEIRSWVKKFEQPVVYTPATIWEFKDYVFKMQNGFYRQNYTWPLIDAYDFPNASSADKARVLFDIFRLYQDRQGEAVALNFLANNSNGSDEERARILWSATEFLEFDQKIANLEKIRRVYGNTAYAAPAGLALGSIYASNGNYDEAVTLLRSANEPNYFSEIFLEFRSFFKSDLKNTPSNSDREPWEPPAPQRIGMPRNAEWLIGDILLKQGKYTEALRQYETAKPYSGGCPTGEEDRPFILNYKKAFASEMLGKYSEASKIYALTQNMDESRYRLILLYLSSKQEEDIQEFARNVDSGKVSPNSKLLRNSFSFVEQVRDSFALSQAAGRNDTQFLAKQLVGPVPKSQKLAAHYLIEIGPSALPSLSEKCEEMAADNEWYLFVLSRLGTPESLSLALQCIKSRSANANWDKNEKGWLFALYNSGEAGYKIIKQYIDAIPPDKEWEKAYVNGYFLIVNPPLKYVVFPKSYPLKGSLPKAVELLAVQD